MTQKQRILLMMLWRDAAKAQGWDPSDESRRHALYAKILGAEKRFSEFSNADFDRVKAAFQRLADRLQGAIEEDHPEMGEARRLREVIDREMRCLALYVEDPRAYVRELIKDKFNRSSRVSVPEVDDLSAQPTFRRAADGRMIEGPSPLHQLLFTLRQRLHNKRTGFRVMAGDTLHDMCMKADLECHCADCQIARGASCGPRGVPADFEPIEAVGQPF